MKNTPPSRPPTDNLVHVLRRTVNAVFFGWAAAVIALSVDLALDKSFFSDPMSLIYLLGGGVAAAVFIYPLALIVLVPLHLLFSSFHQWNPRRAAIVGAVCGACIAGLVFALDSSDGIFLHCVMIPVPASGAAFAFSYVKYRQREVKSDGICRRLH
jgi:hypothetical protein